MNIVIDGRLLLPYFTGIGRYLTGLVEGIYDMHSSDQFEIWLQAGLPINHSIWKFQSERIVILKVSLRQMDPYQLFFVPFNLLIKKPDVFHYPHFDLPWFIPGKVVSTIHDIKYISNPDFFPSIPSFRRLLIYLMTLITIKRSNHIITVSEHSRQDFIRIFKMNPNKISVIHHGVDHHFFLNPDKEQFELLRAKYKIYYPFILSVGERRPHKNLTGVIKSFHLFINSANTDHHLVLVGRRYADYYGPEELVDTLDIKQRVHFLDYVPDEDLSFFYHAADVFILLSLYEGFGLPILEAMASGTPVLASNTTALPEVIGDAGLCLFPTDYESAAEALKEIILSENLREILIERGLQRAEQFKWEECARKTIMIYHNLMS